MNKRFIVTMGAILTAAVGGCQHAEAAGESKPALVGPGGASLVKARPAPIAKTEERYKDSQGFQLVLDTDSSVKGKVRARAFDPDGKPIEVKEIQLEDRALLCLTPEVSPSSPALDPAKSNCQLVNYVSDGTLIKLGKTSCTCYVIGGYAYCYGSTCH